MDIGGRSAAAHKAVTIALEAKRSPLVLILADWNGLTIAALVNAAVTFGETSWLVVAREAFDFIVTTMTRKVGGENRLGHAFRDGTLVFPP
jgi:uncharacterized protein YyaL (SSP411 family)